MKLGEKNACGFDPDFYWCVCHVFVVRFRDRLGRPYDKPVDPGQGRCEAEVNASPTEPESCLKPFI
jgi:hypothetical protein